MLQTNINQSGGSSPSNKTIFDWTCSAAAKAPHPVPSLSAVIKIMQTSENLGAFHVSSPWLTKLMWELCACPIFIKNFHLSSTTLLTDQNISGPVQWRPRRMFYIWENKHEYHNQYHHHCQQSTTSDKHFFNIGKFRGLFSSPPGWQNWRESHVRVLFSSHICKKSILLHRLQTTNNYFYHYNHYNNYNYNNYKRIYFQIQQLHSPLMSLTFRRGNSPGQ